MTKPILFNYFRSSTSYRARIALYFKDIPFEYRAVHLLKNEQHSPEFRKLNPQGEVPALSHEGKLIAQSLPIMEYLDEVFPGPQLYPTDAFERARVRQFCENINSFMHPLTNLKVMQELEKRHGYDQAKKNEWANHWYQIGFTALEKMLNETAGTYSFGGTITAADACLIPVMFSAKRFQIDTSNFPLCQRIEAQCLKHEAFKKAHPMNQPDTPKE